MLQQQNIPLQIGHGHTETTVVLNFSRMTERIDFSPEQARKFIESVQKTLDGLERYMAEKKAAIPPLAMAANDGAVAPDTEAPARG